MAIYSGFSHEKWWFSIATLNYQRVCEFAIVSLKIMEPNLSYPVVDHHFSMESQGHFGESISYFQMHPKSCTIWLFNIAMENGPFIDGLPIINGDFPWLC